MIMGRAIEGLLHPLGRVEITISMVAWLLARLDKPLAINTWTLLRGKDGYFLIKVTVDKVRPPCKKEQRKH